MLIERHSSVTEIEVNSAGLPPSKPIKYTIRQLQNALVHKLWPARSPRQEVITYNDVTLRLIKQILKTAFLSKPLGVGMQCRSYWVTRFFGSNMIIYIWLLVSNEIIIPICHKVCDVGLFSTIFFSRFVVAAPNPSAVSRMQFQLGVFRITAQLCFPMVHYVIRWCMCTSQLGFWPPHPTPPHFTDLPSLKTTDPVICRDSNLLKFAKNVEQYWIEKFKYWIENFAVFQFNFSILMLNIPLTKIQRLVPLFIGSENIADANRWAQNA